MFSRNYSFSITSFIAFISTTRSQRRRRNSDRERISQWIRRSGSSCAVHWGNTVYRHNTSSRPLTSPVNTRRPTTSSSSKARYQLQDPPPSSHGRHPTGNNSSSAGTPHLTPNRYNEWSQPYEDATADALYGDESPPSFHDASLAPAVGSRSEISLGSGVGHFLIRPTR